MDKPNNTLIVLDLSPVKSTAIKKTIKAIKDMCFNKWIFSF